MLCYVSRRNWRTVWPISVWSISLVTAFLSVAVADQQSSPVITVALSELSSRSWTDDSGHYQVHGVLIGVGPKHIRIYKANARNSTVPISRLSRIDQSYVDRIKALHRMSSSPVPADANSRTLARPRWGPDPHFDPEIRFDPRWSSGDLAAGFTAAEVVQLHVSGSLIAMFADRTVERSSQVNDVILGRRVSGSARTTAETNVQLVSNSSQAVFDFVIRGDTVTATTTDAGIVQIHGSGSTRFEKTIRISVNEQGIDIHSFPLQTSTQSEITCISTRARFFRPLVRRIAFRRASRQKAQFDEVARQRAYHRIDSDIETDWRVAVANVNQFVKTAIASFQEAPEFIQLRPRLQTSSNGLNLVLSTPRRSDSLSLPSPPPVVGEPPFVAHIHSSLITSALTDEDVIRFITPLIERLRRDNGRAGQFAEIRKRVEENPPEVKGFPLNPLAAWSTVVWYPTKPRERLVHQLAARRTTHPAPSESSPKSRIPLAKLD